MLDRASFLSLGAEQKIVSVARKPFFADRELLRQFCAAQGTALSACLLRARLVLRRMRFSKDRRANDETLFYFCESVREFCSATRMEIEAEPKFGNQPVSYEQARAQGGLLLLAFLGRLESVLTPEAMRKMSYICAYRRIVAPWHTDNNRPSPFRRFGITTGKATVFLEASDVPRFSRGRWMTGEVIEKLLASGYIRTVELQPGWIYSWGHNEWHRTPLPANQDDLMIVGELEL